MSADPEPPEPVEPGAGSLREQATPSTNRRRNHQRTGVAYHGILRAVAAVDLTGAILDGRYKIIEALAEGAMGVVYKAERLKLGRIVAIKVLHDELPSELSSRKRFEIEAMAMAKLEHPHCAAVLDVGMHDDKPFVVMDFVSGQDLKAVIAGGEVSIPRGVEIMRQVLSGLAHAHELGIIHRDIKPANIILGHKAGLGDHVKILDFGLARLQETSSLTTGIVLGTPAYMAPEQIRGVLIDARADLYACGVLMMELLTGKKPFHSEKDDPIEVVSMHLKKPPPTLAEQKPGTEFGALEAIVARALQKSPEDRYQTAQAFVNALEAVQKRTSSPAIEPPRPHPDESMSEQVSASMMLPNDSTRLGMVAIKGTDAVPGPIARVASAPVAAIPDVASAPVAGAEVSGFADTASEPFASAPASTAVGHAGGALDHPMPTVGSGPVPSAVPSVGSAPIGPRQFLRADTPIPEPDPTPLVSPVIPTQRPHTDPVGVVRPLPVAPMKVSPRGNGLPLTNRQLAIGGGGLLVVILVIALVAGGGGSKAADPGAGSAAPTEIEMEPATSDGAGTVLARAAELAANGEREAAIDLLAKSRSTFPTNADLPYQAGKLYFAKLWWTDGIKNLRDAIRIDPTYKTDPDLLKTVLKAFITTPQYNSEIASFMRSEIGAPMEPLLEETAKSHPNAGKRARATKELERYR
ncbi:MAG: serine/threonine protein kinase [Myxococcales bacterium]|nr:serine/threonine protein kinase [Myxococcales bacterium]